ncbi:MAG: hypothetical protein ACKO96_13160, partial [Flammeovirgaceae bacterium]
MGLMPFEASSFINSLRAFSPFACPGSVKTKLTLLASFYFFRLDLTEEKRYTIKPQTKEMLSALDEEVFV